MSIASMIQSFRSLYRHGSFALKFDERIDDVVRRENVPLQYGVYVISESGRPGAEILCIGKSGTLCQDGTLKAQALRKRLTMKQDGVYRRVFFTNKMKELGLPSLHFEWFVTFASTTHVPPFLAEAQLLAAFYGEFSYLPRWNKAA